MAELVSPRVILLNDPTRASMSAPSRRSTSSFAKLADAGAAIIFYSTDYDELIGCCDAASWCS